MFCRTQNRILPILATGIFLVVTLLGTLSLTQTAYAQESGQPWGGIGQTQEEQLLGTGRTQEQVDEYLGADGVAGTGDDGELAQLGESGGCGWLDVSCWIGEVMLGFGAFIAGLGGSLLDMTITHLVLKMGENITQGGIGLVINSTWGIVRDVVNIMFIFGFIYIGIRTILQPERARTKEFLAQLIIAALLINFSLFFAKLVIDVSNVFALEVYALIGGGEESNLATAFFEAMRAQTFYAQMSGEELHQYTNDGELTFFLMGMLFLVVAGFVFASAAIMLIIRYVALIIIMIFSPLIVASIVFPKAANAAGNILKSLFAYAFYAPIFLFLVYISLRVLDAINYGTEQGFIDALNTQTDASLNGSDVFLQFAVATIFLIASFVLAKGVSSYGGGQIANVGNAVRSYGQRRLGNLTFGAAARFGRATAGYGGSLVTESKWARGLASRSGKGVGNAAARLAGRTALRAGAGVAESSFDARQIGGVGNKLDVGEGQKGGYMQHIKDTTKREQALAKMVGTNDAGAAEKQAEYDQASSERKQQIDRAKRELRNRKQPLLDQLKIAAQNANDNRLSADQRQAAQNDVTRVQSELQTIDGQLQSTIDNLEEIHKNMSTDEAAMVKATKNEPQINYTETLANRFFADPAQRKANRKAAVAIRKDMDKDGNARLLDAIGDLKGSLNK